jgi:hypothetical protein
MADVTLPLVIRYGTVAEWSVYDFDPIEFGVVVNDLDEPTGEFIIGSPVGGVGGYTIFTLVNSGVFSGDAGDIPLGFTPDNFAATTVAELLSLMESVFDEGPVMADNTVAGVDDDGLPVDVSIPWGFSISVASVDGSFIATTGSALIPLRAGTGLLSGVNLVTLGDTVDITISVSGTPINGFATPVEADTTPATTGSTAVLTGPGYALLEWENAGAALTHIGIIGIGTEVF